MLDELILSEMYSKIQRQLFYMIPEKWEKIYLYASVMEQINKLQTGEMFFYYFPKGVLRKNPVNVYEVPNKFNVDEMEYFSLADELYGIIKELRKKFEENGEKLWSNITISIENCQFTIEYNYDNLLGSHYSSYDRHIIWKYKYLKFPIERLSKKDREMVEEYIINEKLKNIEIKKDVQHVYNNKVNNIIDYNKEQIVKQSMEIKNFEIKTNKYTREIPLNNQNSKHITKREYEDRNETKEENVKRKNQILKL